MEWIYLHHLDPHSGTSLWQGHATLFSPSAWRCNRRRMRSNQLKTIWSCRPEPPRTRKWHGWDPLAPATRIGSIERKCAVYPALLSVWRNRTPVRQTPAARQSLRWCTIQLCPSIRICSHRTAHRQPLTANATKCTETGPRWERTTAHCKLQNEFSSNQMPSHWK